MSAPTETPEAADASIAPEPTVNAYEAVCPWCEDGFEAWELAIPDGDFEPIDCPNCERQVTVELKIVAPLAQVRLESRVQFAPSDVGWPALHVRESADLVYYYTVRPHDEGASS